MINLSDVSSIKEIEKGGYRPYTPFVEGEIIEIYFKNALHISCSPKDKKSDAAARKAESKAESDRLKKATTLKDDVFNYYYSLDCKRANGTSFKLSFLNLQKTDFQGNMITNLVQDDQDKVNADKLVDRTHLLQLGELSHGEILAKLIELANAANTETLKVKVNLQYIKGIKREYGIPKKDGDNFVAGLEKRIWLELV